MVTSSSATINEDSLRMMCKCVKEWHYSHENDSGNGLLFQILGKNTRVLAIEGTDEETEEDQQ